MHLFYKYFKEKMARLLRLLVNLLWACFVLILPRWPGSSEESVGRGWCFCTSAVL